MPNIYCPKWEHEHKWLCVYVLYVVGESRWRCHVSKRFFRQQGRELDTHLVHHQLFLQLNEAYDYSRFVGENYVIIKAMVPEMAIIGNTRGLALRPGYLNSQHCQGLYLSWKPEAKYMENPHFQAA